MKEVADEQRKQDEVVNKVKHKMDKIKSQNKRRSSSLASLSQRSQHRSVGKDDAPTKLSDKQSQSPQPSLPVEAFDDAQMATSRHEHDDAEMMAVSSPHTWATAIASPTSVRERGIFTSIALMQSSCDELVKHADLGEIVGDVEPNPDTSVCILRGPNVDAASAEHVPFATSPTQESMRKVNRIEARRAIRDEMKKERSEEKRQKVLKTFERRLKKRISKDEQKEAREGESGREE